MSENIFVSEYSSPLTEQVTLIPAEQQAFEAIAEAEERETFNAIIAEIDTKVSAEVEEEQRATMKLKTGGRGNFMFTYDSTEFC